MIMFDERVIMRVQAVIVVDERGHGAHRAPGGQPGVSPLLLLRVCCVCFVVSSSSFPMPTEEVRACACRFPGHAGGLPGAAGVRPVAR